MASIPPIFTEWSDLAILQIPSACMFGTGADKLRRLNISSVWTSLTSDSSQMVSPTPAFPYLTCATLVVGDLNIHHASGDALRNHSSSERLASCPHFLRASDLGYSLLNLLSICNRLPISGAARPWVLDLAFASIALAPVLPERSTPLHSTGSDQITITMLLTHPIRKVPPPASN